MATEVESPPRMVEAQVFTDGGPWAMHNMPCAVCHTNKAVLHLNEGVFEPCWDCQRKGWKIEKQEKSWWHRFFLGWAQRDRLAEQCLPTTPPSDSGPPEQVWPPPTERALENLVAALKKENAELQEQPWPPPPASPPSTMSAKENLNMRQLILGVEKLKLVIDALKEENAKLLERLGE